MLVSGNLTIFVNTYQPETIQLTVKKYWDDENDKAKLRPGVLRVRLNWKAESGEEGYNGYTDYYLSAANNWTVTTTELPAQVNGVKIAYSWSEQSVIGYTMSKEETSEDGLETTFTNRYRIPTSHSTPPGTPPVVEKVIPLDIQLIINHVGDCFD